jgi:hypothetical protein
VKTLKFICLLVIGFTFIMGCSGNSGNFKMQSEGDSKVTRQELIDNWSDYHISYRTTAIVFDPKNDDRRILLGGKKGWHWATIKDQETWTEFAKTNITSDGDIIPVRANDPMNAARDDGFMTGVREIWGPDNQHYGLIITQEMDTVSTRLVDENTLRLWYNRSRNNFKAGP